MLKCPDIDIIMYRRDQALIVSIVDLANLECLLSDSSQELLSLTSINCASRCAESDGGTYTAITSPDSSNMAMHQ